MAHPDQETFVLEVTDPNEVDWDEINRIMDAANKAQAEIIQEISNEHAITDGQASDILYLRTRSRWTQEKEDYLIWCFQNSKESPDIMDDFEVPENYREE